MRALSFILFWWSCFKAARNKAWNMFGQLRGIAAIASFLSLSFGAYGILTNQATQINYWLVATPVVLATCVFLYFFIRAPHHIHCEGIREAECQNKSLSAEIDNRKKTITSLTADLERLKDDKAQRQKVMETLGAGVSALRTRLNVIRNIHYTTHTQECRVKEDQASMMVIRIIYDSIKQVCGIAEAEFFAAVKLPPPVQNQDWRVVNLHDHLAYLEAHIECLKDLIEKHR
jgi:hypothetical protein